MKNEFLKDFFSFIKAKKMFRLKKFQITISFAEQILGTLEVLCVDPKYFELLWTTFHSMKTKNLFMSSRGYFRTLFWNENLL